MSQQLVTILQKLNAAENRESNLENSHTPGNHTNHNLIPNLSGPMKLEFPSFFGEEPTSWIYKANQHFTYYNILDNEKLMMASFHMDGEALVWFQEGEDVGVIRNWEKLVQALLIKFGTPAYVDPMEALTRLRQINNGSLQGRIQGSI